MSGALASFVPGDAAAERRVPSRALGVRAHGAEAFHLLRPFWNELLRTSRADSLFLGWEWQEAWWRHFGAPAGRELRVLSVHDPGERLVGLAPMYRERRSWNGIPLRTLRLIGDGSGDGDDLDVFSAPGQEAAVAAALVRYLQQAADWDVIDVCPIPAESESLRALTAMADGLGWYARRRALECTLTPLPGDWDEFLATLKPRLRSRCRSLLRRHVDRGGDGRLVAIDGAGDLDHALEILFGLHQRRWEAIGEPGAFIDAPRRRFFRDLAFHGLRNGSLRLWVLYAQDQPVAAQIGFVHGGVFLAVQEGFDPDRASTSPGVALRAAVLRACIEEGLTAYDNLLGTPPQKLRWGAEPRRVVGLTLARPGSAGASALRFIDVGRTARDALRGWLERAT